MKTSKPLSIVSFNTPSFLEQKLNELIANKKIDFYYSIAHEGETQKHTGTKQKDHAHILILHSDIIDLKEMKEYFNEYDPTNDKPLGIMYETSNNLDEKMLYDLHDKRYCENHKDKNGKLKPLIKEKYNYDPKDIKTSDIEQLNMILNSAYEYLEDYTTNMYTQIKNDILTTDLSLTDIICKYNANPVQIRSFFYDVMNEKQIFNNSPTVNLDLTTGELTLDVKEKEYLLMKKQRSKN